MQHQLHPSLCPMKILVVQASADGILAKPRSNAKSAKTMIKKGCLSCF